MTAVNPGSGVPYSRYLGLDATESELRNAIGDPGAVYVEWENAGLTWIMSDRYHVIVRTGALGGDVRDVQGGWKYLRREHMLKEWEEIKAVAESFRRGQGRIEG
jgi:hypothetical protein